MAMRTRRPNRQGAEAGESRTAWTTQEDLIGKQTEASSKHTSQSLN